PTYLFDLATIGSELHHIYSSGASFVRLPLELVEEICENCAKSDCIALSSTSRFTRKAALHLVWRDIQIWPTGSGNTDPTRLVLEASQLNKEDRRDLMDITEARGFPQTFILQWGSEAVVVLLLDCMPRLKKLTIPGYQASSSLLSLRLRNIVSPPSCFLTIQHLTFTHYTSIQTAKAWLLLSSLKIFVLEAIDGDENEDEEENTTVDMVKLEGSKDDAQICWSISSAAGPAIPYI
ncbi:hypothetical protein FIBSPDRAFT_1020172, partial [Athelia psychrophila]